MFNGFTLSKIILIFLPFICAVILAGKMLFSFESKKSALNKILVSSTQSVEEKKIANIVSESNKKSIKFIEKQNAKLNLLGIDYKFEALAAISAGLFVVGTIVSRLLFKAGPFLMVYLGVLLAMSVYAYINRTLSKRKAELTLEFLEKMRDVASFLSVGKSLNNALQEASSSGNISKVMQRELEQVRRDVYTGQKESDAFMAMYDRLQIEDIRIYAETLKTFEESGGNLIQVMKANDKFATSKLEIRNEQNIFAEGQKSSQKVVIGVPLAMIVGFFLFNPSFFGDFYSTLVGQIIAIVCVTVLIIGVVLSNQLARIDA